MGSHDGSRDRECRDVGVQVEVLDPQRQALAMPRPVPSMVSTICGRRVTLRWPWGEPAGFPLPNSLAQYRYVLERDRSDRFALGSADRDRIADRVERRSAEPDARHHDRDIMSTSLAGRVELMCAAEGSAARVGET